MSIDTMTAINAGPTPLIAAICDDLGLESTLNELLPWHPSYRELSPGTLVKALIINILTSRTPLYLVEEFYDDHDVELLLGSNVKASQLNDDALGRVLDLLHKSEAWRVYSTWSLRVLDRLGLSLGALHNDTTSVSLQGAYLDTADLAVTYGHSKDKRPDLKQILMGMGVTPERLPIFAKVEDGNLHDRPWNFAFISRMREMLSDEQWSGMTYVSDSALVSPDNIALLMKQGGAFITRLPDTYKLCSELKQAAIADNEWQQHGKLASATNSSHYRSASFTRRLYDHEFRFMVVHSSRLYELQHKTLLRKVEKERIAIHEAASKLMKQTYSCAQDAETALASILKKSQYKWHACQMAVEQETYSLTRKKRGRPKAGEVPEEGIRYRIQAQAIQQLQERIAEEEKQLGMFVLMTSHREDETWTDLRVLQTYKGQDAAETRFRLLKNPTILNAVYVKTPRRIEALGIVFVMALMVYGVMEWRVREQLKRDNEPMLVAGKKKSMRPTAEMMLSMLSVMQVMQVRMQDGTRFRQIDDGIPEKKRRIIECAGYSMDIYITPPAALNRSPSQ